MYRGTANQLDRIGAELLRRIAADPDDACWRHFQQLFYKPVWEYLCANHRIIGVRVARHVGRTGSVAPPIPDSEVDEVAHDATSRALRRACAKAAMFDPARATASRWLFALAEFAYVEVAKEITNSRRPRWPHFVDLEDLDQEADPHPSTEEFVIRHLSSEQALADVASRLTPDEWLAVRLVYMGSYSYREAAQRVFGDASKTKALGKLLERGKCKLKEAWSDQRNSTPGSPGTKVSDGDDE